jgi:THAP4-like, heme-binding beta-barrel domain
MTDTLTQNRHLFSRLEGTWTGEGRGEFSGVTSFAYRETLVFTRRDDKSLAYSQQAQKRYDGQTEWLVSHWESGFIRILDNGELELISAQIGRSEILIGSVELLENIVRIPFVSKTIANDPRMISSRRMFEVDGDTLRYEMEMHTTKVERLTPHLKISLQRVR